MSYDQRIKSEIKVQFIFMIILNVKHNKVECKANVRQDNNECGAVSGACEGSTYTCLRDTPVSSQYVFWAQRIEILEPKTNIQVQCRKNRILNEEGILRARVRHISSDAMSS